MIENREDESLAQELRRLFQLEVDGVGGMPLSVRRVRTVRPLGAATIAISALVVVAAVVFANQRGLSMGSPQATATSPGSTASAVASSSSSPAETSASTPIGGASNTFQLGLVEVIDRSTQLTAARRLGAFEFVPAPPKSGSPFAFNPGGKPSADVGIIWFGSTCGPKSGYRVTIDKAAQSIRITVNPDGAGTWCADLGTVGIVLEFRRAIDASAIVVTFSSS